MVCRIIKPCKDSVKFGVMELLERLCSPNRHNVVIWNNDCRSELRSRTGITYIHIESNDYILHVNGGYCKARNPKFNYGDLIVYKDNKSYKKNFRKCDLEEIININYGGI